MDYDKKFQEDLEKAAALSLESLALDQFRRTKLLSSSSSSDVTNASKTIRIARAYARYETAFHCTRAPLFFTMLFLICAFQTTTTIRGLWIAGVAPYYDPGRNHLAAHRSKIPNRTYAGKFSNFPITPIDLIICYVYCLWWRTQSISYASIAPPPSTPRTSRSSSDRADGDLISFTNPTDNSMAVDLATENVSGTIPVPSEESHEKFKQIVSQIHRYVPVPVWLPILLRHCHLIFLLCTPFSNADM